MGKISKKFSISREIREKLKIISNRRNAPKSLVERCKMVLECADNIPIKDIAMKHSTYSNKVIYWRDRFIECGIDGLKDKKRSGRPVLDKTLKIKVLNLINKPPPKGYSRWDAVMIADKLNCSKDAIWRILRNEGIHLHRKRSWCISTDKEFAAKAADIIGLYLAPPQNAIVLSIDEKPSIQALERQTGYIETENDKIMRAYKSTYKRNGTLNLFAALNVRTGQIAAEGTKTKTREDFIKFMDKIIKENADHEEIHVILDNYCTHKKNEEWLKKHPNVKFYFTPTSASWLNQIEIWFGILSRKSLDGVSFTNTEQLKEHIMAFIESYNENCEPFKWRKRKVRGSQIANNIENLRN